MKFSDFLKNYKAKHGFTSARVLFENLGGTKELGISLRQFQLIESGDQVPTPKVFASIFSAITRDEYRNALLSFFESTAESDTNSPLNEYLKEHLNPAFLRSEQSVWDSGRPLMTYSADQLDLLSTSLDALKLQNRLTLWEKIPKRELRVQDDIVKRLVNAELASWKGDHLQSSRTLFRVPRHEESAPSVARRATRYLLRHLDAYVSEEGNVAQEISYAIQLVPKSTAKNILEQMKNFKKWVQGVASEGTGPELVPFVFLGFGKTLENRDF